LGRRFFDEPSLHGGIGYFSLTMPTAVIKSLISLSDSSSDDDSRIFLECLGCRPTTAAVHLQAHRTPTSMSMPLLNGTRELKFTGQHSLNAVGQKVKQVVVMG
jgi:hypothetical protein